MNIYTDKFEISGIGEYYPLVVRNVEGSTLLSIKTRPNEQIMIKDKIISMGKLVEVLNRIPEDWLV